MRNDKTQTSTPRIISREHTRLSDWVTLETISVAPIGEPDKIDIFHAFRQDDYVHVFPMTPQGLFVLIRQYRPVIETWTLEFPGGLRDLGEDPEATAARELREETGLAAVEMVPLIECMADVGRLHNKFFGFFALAEEAGAAEPGIERILLSGEELRSHAAGGRIAPASHIGLLYLAGVHPKVHAICRQCGYATPPWLS
jgi:8-oxo-dGTP pyrophosphatase MutT (NUDIX family)